MEFINTALAAEIPALSKLTSGVDTIYRYSISVGGILAFGIIIFAGIEYIVSAGNVARQSDAKSRIFNALLGLVILLGAVLIAQGIPGLLTFNELNIITPTPPNSGKVATYGSSNRLTPTRETLVRSGINQRLDAAGSDPEKIKSVLIDLQDKNSVAGRQIVQIFFEEVKKRGLDDDLFFAYKSVIEKAGYIRALRDNSVRVADIIANAKTGIDYADLYSIYIYTSDFTNPKDNTNEFTNSFDGPKLAVVFVNFYKSGSSLAGVTPEARLAFINSLNDKKIGQLYDNLTLGDQIKDTLTVRQLGDAFKQALTELNRDIVNFLK